MTISTTHLPLPGTRQLALHHALTSPASPRRTTTLILCCLWCSPTARLFHQASSLRRDSPSSSSKQETSRTAPRLSLLTAISSSNPSSHSAIYLRAHSLTSNSHFLNSRFLRLPSLTTRGSRLIQQTCFTLTACRIHSTTTNSIHLRGHITSPTTSVVVAITTTTCLTPVTRLPTELPLAVQPAETPRRSLPTMSAQHQS